MKLSQIYELFRLGQVFKYISDPFLLRNSTGSIMYHFYMSSNNKTAVKIANDLVKKELS